jgi:HSP20 family protein
MAHQTMNILKTMSQLFTPESKPAAPVRQRTTYVTPLANILETAEGYVLQAELPGVDKSGLSVTVENGELTIVGTRTRRETSGQLLHRERRSDDFRRSFEIDASIDASRITAKLDQGLLTLNLPKSEAVKPRTIAVGDN